MNWNQIKGGWQQLAGQVRGNWNKLTEEELNTITANRDQLISFLFSCYCNFSVGMGKFYTI